MSRFNSSQVSYTVLIRNVCKSYFNVGSVNESIYEKILKKGRTRRASRPRGNTLPLSYLAGGRFKTTRSADSSNCAANLVRHVRSYEIRSLFADSQLVLLESWIYFSNWLKTRLFSYILALKLHSLDYDYIQGD